MTRQKINRVSGLLLALGLGSAIAIYFLAGPPEVDPLRSDPLGNKRFRHEMQVIGGKANLLADDFAEWFSGLWQGQELAGTVAVLTIGATLVFRFVAGPPENEERRHLEVPPEK